MKTKKTLAIMMSVVMLLCMLPVFAFAAGVTTIQVSDGIPASSSGTGWMYNPSDNTVYLYNNGDFAFAGGELTCNVNSNGNITAGVFSGEIFSFGGKISGGTFKGSVKSRFDTVSGGTFIGEFDSLGTTVTGGMFSGDTEISAETYLLTILNGHVKDTSLVSVRVFPGTKVSVETDLDSDSFARWISFSDVPVAFDDEKSMSVTFVMPNGDVNIIAADASDDYNPDIDNDGDGDVDYDDIIPGASAGSAISTIINLFFGVMEYVIGFLKLLF
ncbi:MAG: hypothetical protein IJO24_01660 [Clostridia bacterium]|nr:hypothetical protein [Clostridia bacterium]